ncbi:9606_t:CDS:2, partial [Dentiscutata erythropus]
KKALIEKQIRIAVVGLNEVKQNEQNRFSLFIYDGNNSLFVSRSLKKEIEDSTELSIQRENQTGQYLEINNNRINLDNILANLEVLYQQTVDGIQLRIKYISTRPETF